MILPLPLSSLAPLLLIAALLAEAHKIPEQVEGSHYDYAKCGKVTKRPKRSDDDGDDALDFHVMGGRDALPGEHPWAVAVQGPKRELCAGTLVSRRHVVTAAHCLLKNELVPSAYSLPACEKGLGDAYDMDDYMNRTRVLWGGTCRRADKGCDSPHNLMKNVSIRKLTRFPFFEQHCSGGSDLVLFELDQDLPVPHACLPHLHNTEDFSLIDEGQQPPFVSFGWGEDPLNKKKTANQLQVIELGLRKDACAEMWDATLSPDLLCYQESRTADLCAGDSGAGLLTIIDERVFVLGVHSFGSPCGALLQGAAAPRAQAFTDLRLFTASLDAALGTTPALPAPLVFPGDDAPSSSSRLSSPSTVTSDPSTPSIPLTLSTPSERPFPRLTQASETTTLNKEE